MDIFTIALFLLIAFVMSGWVIYWLRGRKWPTAEGRVERCERATFSVGKYHTEVQGIRLYYSFQVKGEYYGGHFAQMGFSLESQIDDFVEKFKPGARVVVRYDPKNFDSSMLRLIDNPDLDIGLLSGAPLTNFDDQGPTFTDLKL